MGKFTAAVERAKIDIVPKTVVNMGGGQEKSSSVNAFELLIGLLTSEKLGVRLNEANPGDREKAQAFRDAIMKSIGEQPKTAAEIAEEFWPEVIA
jgi:hypothetical protein